MAGLRRIPFLWPGTVGVVLAAMSWVLYDHDLEQAKERWSLVADAKTSVVEERLRDIFSSLYEGLRTIARLPGVRNLSRHAENLDDNARRTIQEIYNNLATGVAMSEVYIVPLDLDPEAVDPVTGELQAPSITFDELIVGRSADEHGSEHEADEGPEEIEIFEYRLMREQLAHFKRICPEEVVVRGLDYPALTGQEVVTCDNRFYSLRAPDDQDRSGIVYSVPVFGDDGKLRGCVSGVILTRALRDCLPEGCYALRHKTHGYTAGSMQPGPWSDHALDVDAVRTAPDLVYSRVIPLGIVDREAGWMLWAGRPNEEFAYAPDTVQAHVTFAMLCVVSITLAIGLALRERSGRRRAAEERQRTVELQRARDVAENLSRARSNLVAITSEEIRTPLEGLASMADLLLRSELSSEQRTVVESARQSSRTLIALLNGILDYSALESDKVAVEAAEFDLHDLFENVLLLMAPVVAGRPIELVLDLGDELPQRVVGDRARLRQIVASLLSNAAKFTNQGTIAVHVDWFALGDESLLCVRVTDTGVGIDPAVRDHLFQPFVQGDGAARVHGGLGLGLAISHGLAEAMGGTLDLLPETGTGAAFALTVPLQLPTIRSVSPRPLARRRIGVVLSKERWSAMVAADLRALGADVVVVRDAATACAMHHAGGPPFDAMLLERGADGALPAECVGADPATAPAVVLTETWDQAILDRKTLPDCVREIVRLPLGRSSLGAAVLRAFIPGHRPAAEAPPEPARSMPAPTLVRSEAPVAAKVDEAPSPAAAHKPLALVVDGRDTASLITSAALRRVGFLTAEAPSAAAALAIARQRPLACVVVDWRLPGGAVAFVSALRGVLHELGRPMVAVVGIADAIQQVDRDTAETAGLAALLPHPVNARQLADKLAPLAAPR